MSTPKPRPVWPRGSHQLQPRAPPAVRRAAAMGRSVRSVRSATIEFRRRFHVVVMDPEQAALYKLQASMASFILAWWRLEDRRGRAAAATRKFEARLELLEQAGDWNTAAQYTAAYKREQLQKKVTHFGYCADDPRPEGRRVFWTRQQLEFIAWKASGGLNAGPSSPASPEGGIVFYWRFGAPSPHAVRDDDLLLDRAVRYTQAWWRFSRSQTCHRHHPRHLQFVFEVRRRSWVRSGSVRRKRFVIAEQAWLDIKDSVAPAVSKRPCACYRLRPLHPLHDTYAILPRTKWGVLALPGAPPPKEPSDGLDLTTRKGKARARNVALYYVSNFTPWSAFEPPTLEHDAWRQHCEELRRTASLDRAKWEDSWPEEQGPARRKERYIAASRLFDIENVMSGFRAPKEATVLPTKHRARATTYWQQRADGKPHAYGGHGWQQGKDAADAAKDIAALQEKADKLRSNTRDVVTRMREVNDMEEQAKNLLRHLPSKHFVCAPLPPLARGCAAGETHRPRLDGGRCAQGQCRKCQAARRSARAAAWRGGGRREHRLVSAASARRGRRDRPICAHHRRRVRGGLICMEGGQGCGAARRRAAAQRGAARRGTPVPRGGAD
jgi:hypothetical protein